MDNIKTSKFYLEKIIKDLNFIIEHTRNISFDDFVYDEILNNCICFKLIQISENTSKLPKSFKDNYKNIPWVEITGLRNRIVHDYASVNLAIVYKTVIDDISFLLNELNKIYICI